MNLNLISDGTYDRRPGPDPRISGFCCSQLLPGGTRLLSTKLYISFIFDYIVYTFCIFYIVYIFFV